MTTADATTRVLDVLDALEGRATYAAIWMALGDTMTGHQIERGINGAIKAGLMRQTGKQPGIGPRYERVKEGEG